MKHSRTFLASVATTLAFLSTPHAHAYNFGSHAAMAKAAGQLLAQANPAPTACTDPLAPTLPSGAAWDTFLAEAGEAYQRLTVLRSGLAPINSDISRCTQYDPQDNMSKLGNIQVAHLKYLADRDYEDSCNLIRVEKGDSRVLASVLGWHAGMADNRVEDTSVWIKPLNAQYWGAYKDGLSYGWNVAAGVALAPIACFISLFTDGDCGDGFDWAKEYNPVDYAAFLVPGIPGTDFRMDEFNGIWHHMETSAIGPIEAQYNEPPGIFYLTAGPSNVPGVVDATIFAIGYTTGLTVEWNESLGPKDFGQFDDVSRNAVHWEAHHIGTTEFSPVDNLGQYGWKRYTNNGNSISIDGLGWALHALADVSFPQHIAATTAWGHRPMEDAIGELDFEILKLNKDGQFVDCAFRNQMWLDAFKWWLQSKDSFDFEFMMHRIGETSWSRIGDSEGVWSDSASTQYALGGKDASVESYKDEDYDGSGMSLTDFVRPLASDTVGGMVAMLIQASNRVNVGGAYDPTAFCPTGTHYMYPTGCVSGPASPSTNPIYNTTSGMEAECVNPGALCDTDHPCCDNQTCENGQCRWLEGICGQAVPSAPCTCGNAGANCKYGYDCCNGHECVQSKCVDSLGCGAAGATCKYNSDCCQVTAQICAANKCVAAPSSCTVNNGCGTDPTTSQPCCAGYTCVIHMARCVTCSTDPAAWNYCDACGAGKPAYTPASFCP